MTAAVLSGRLAAERLMTTEVVITRAGEGDMVDPVTGERERVEVYSGKAKLTSYEAHESASLSGGRVITTQRMTLHVPVGSYEAQVGDLATVTDSTDPLLVGRQVRITQQAPYKEHATAYRCFVDEVTR